MIHTTPELTAHLTKRALELEQLADGIAGGVIDPAKVAHDPRRSPAQSAGGAPRSSERYAWP